MTTAAQKKLIAQEKAKKENKDVSKESIQEHPKTENSAIQRELDKLKKQLLSSQIENQEHRNRKAFEASEARNNKRDEDALIKNLESYTFFTSVSPDMTYTLTNGDRIVFTLQRKVLEADKAGNPVRVDTWGMFFTKSKELVAELKGACLASTQIQHVTGEDRDELLRDLRHSVTDNK